ncbi:MAG: GGDEF domain-containing protein [Bilifractor sp.]
MVIFSLGIVGVGVLAQIFYGDLTDNWCCISICYLFMILAIDQMYAKTDLVTRLHNREVYLKMLRHHRRENRPLTVVMFDLNHLKHVNDQRGHADGDAYLRAFGQTAQKALAPYGELFRIGGDEFCMLSITTTPAQLLPVLEEIQGREKCDPEYGDFPLDFAFGLAGQRSGEDGDETVHRADQMMYENKRKMHAADRHSDYSI